jgi:uncharacterized protein (TIGR03000 family)
MSVAALAGLIVPLLASAPSGAQTVGVTPEYRYYTYDTRRPPVLEPALPGATSIRDWDRRVLGYLTTYDVAPHHAPTYLTSINYPLVYGAYIYPFPLKGYRFGAQPTPFTTAPTVYGDYYAPGYNAAILSTEIRSLRPDLAATNSAILNVRVPTDDTVLTLNGVVMRTPGQSRTFTVPNLIPATPYLYDVTATWTDNGRQTTRNRSITFQSGDNVTVDFVSGRTERGGTAILRTEPLP